MRADSESEWNATPPVECKENVRLSDIVYCFYQADSMDVDSPGTAEQCRSVLCLSRSSLCDTASLVLSL